MIERVSKRRAKEGDTSAQIERAAPTPSGQASSSPRNTARPKSKNVIALVYDFDGTLSPKPMQEYAFLPKLGIKAEDFWAECTALARAERADPLITYMHLMYKKAKERGIRIDRADLVAQGRHVELYAGVPKWFAAIDRYVADHAKSTGATIKHYLVSSGLTEIIEGTSIYKNFANVFASEYWFDAYDLPFPKRVITDTGKTQYLFRINKGLEDYNDSINAHMPEALRPIPFSNMVYFGDGETDVPSMALLKKNGGAAIAVYTPGGSAEKCFDLFKAGRCDFYAAADYRPRSDLFRRTTLLLDRIIAEIAVREEGKELG